MLDIWIWVWYNDCSGWINEERRATKVLSEMQERLREEYDRMNCQVGLSLSLDGTMLSYETYENLCMIEMEIWG